MRHFKALVLMLRLIGIILLLFAGFIGFLRMMALGALANSDLTLNAAFYISFFMPSVIGIAVGIGCLVAAGIIHKKSI